MPSMVGFACLRPAAGSAHGLKISPKPRTSLFKSFLYLILLICATQDVVQFIPLSKTLTGQMVADPGLIPQILKHVGPLPLLDWARHFIALGLYSALNAGAAPLIRSVAGRLPPKQQYSAHRTLEAWKYGSGGDYRL